MNNNENFNINNQNPYGNGTNNATQPNPVAPNMSQVNYAAAQPQVAPAQPTMQQPQAAPTTNVAQNTTSAVDPMAAVASLNKEEAMEEALSHTNQYTPFEVPKQEVAEAPKKENSKSAYILIGVIVVIMALFILFLPQISKLFGW